MRISKQWFHHIVLDDGTDLYRFAEDKWEIARDGKIVPAQVPEELERDFQKHMTENPEVMISDPTKISISDVPDASISTEIHHHTQMMASAALLTTLYRDVLKDADAEKLIRNIRIAIIKSANRAMDAKSVSRIMAQCDAKAARKVFELRQKDETVARMKNQVAQKRGRI